MKIIATVFFEIILMATAWTVCVTAPMPWNIIVPVAIGALRIISRVVQIKSKKPETEQGNGKSKKAAECGEQNGEVGVVGVYDNPNKQPKTKRKIETSAEKREEREKRGKARNSTTKGQWE